MLSMLLCVRFTDTSVRLQNEACLAAGGGGPDPPFAPLKLCGEESQTTYYLLGVRYTQSRLSYRRVNCVFIGSDYLHPRFIEEVYKVCPTENPVSEDLEAFMVHEPTHEDFFPGVLGFVSAPDKMLLSVFIATDQATLASQL